MFNPNDALIALTQSRKPMANLKLFLGATDFVAGADFVRFKFKGNTVMNSVTIRITPADLYEITFEKVGQKADPEMKKLGVKVMMPYSKTVEQIDGLFADQIKETFEKTTSLYLSM